MLKENRVKQILTLLKQNGEVQINTLCRSCNVTEMTIRRDLDELAAQGALIRTHGGAVLVGEDLLVERPFEKRLDENMEQKEKIAQKALEMIRSGMKIVLDSGSTTYYLARILPGTYRLAVLTNALNIATELSHRTNIDVTFVGGELKKNTMACVGSYTTEMLKRFSVDIAFLGSSGISHQGSFYTATSAQVEVKVSMMQIADKKVLLADASKFRKKDYAYFAQSADFDCLVTSGGIPAETERILRESELELFVIE